MLLEGEDLTVENGRVMVRTVAGLRPVSVLWRRLDAAFADPLELDATSRLGTPGLVGAAPPGLRHPRQRARLRHPRDPRAPRLPPPHRRGAPRPAAHPAQHRHLVVRPGLRARARPRQQGPDDDRPGALHPPPLRDRRHHRPRQPVPRQGPRLLRRLARGRRRRARRPGDGHPLHHPRLAERRPRPPPHEPARLPRPHARRAGRSCRAASPASATRRRPAPSPCSAAAPPPTSG